MKRYGIDTETGKAVEILDVGFHTYNVREESGHIHTVPKRSIIAEPQEYVVRTEGY